MTGLIEQGLFLGEWDEALARFDETVQVSDAADDTVYATGARMLVERGEDDAARKHLARLPEERVTADIQLRLSALWRKRLMAELEGRYDDAMAATVECLIESSDLMPSQAVSDVIRDAATYATLSGDHAAALDVAARAEAVSATLRSRAVESQLHRLRANAAAAAGDVDAAADEYGLALANARNLGFAFGLAPVLYDYGSWLVSTGRDAEAVPLLSEARELFERMGARVWLRRLDAVAPSLPVAAANVSQTEPAL